MAIGKSPVTGRRGKAGRAVLCLFLVSLCSLFPGCMGGSAVRGPAEKDAAVGEARRGPAASAVPEGVEARLTGRNAITVSWKDDFRDASGYIVERSAGEGFTEIARVEKGMGRFSDTRLSPSITYSYRICACNSSRRSGYSKPVSVTTTPSSGTIVIDHDCADLLAIPVFWLKRAKASLHIAYGGTASGTQLVSGMRGLAGFRGSLYTIGQEAKEGEALDLRSDAFGDSMDLARPDAKAWVEATKRYVKKHPEVNVVVWSWNSVPRDAARDASRDVEGYLASMEALEQGHPKVVFVYMTAPLDGTGLEGATHRANEEIRDFCRARGKVLYDFADIESYDPDGRYYGNKHPATDCSYDSDMDGRPDANWAAAWERTHREGIDWYDCESPTTMALNANLKASAAWWLWARIAGWNGE